MKATPIQFIQRSGFLVLHIPSTAGDADFVNIPELMAEKLGLPGTPSLSVVIVDFKNSPALSKAKWASLVASLQGIPGRNKFILVNVSAGSEPFVKEKDGEILFERAQTVDAVFELLNTRRSAGALKTSAPPARSIADQTLEKLLLRTFQEAAIKTLEVRCSTVFKPAKPFVKTPDNRLVPDIAASMGLMGKTVTGSVALGFKESVFLKVMSKMLGEQYTSLSGEMLDGCGELLNIIFGQAKKTLSDSGYQFGKTLPTLYTGQTLQVRSLTPSPAFVIPFESNLGQMVLELGYRKT